MQDHLGFDVGTSNNAIYDSDHVETQHLCRKIAVATNEFLSVCHGIFNTDINGVLSQTSNYLVMSHE